MYIHTTLSPYVIVYFKIIHREGLYAAGKSLVCQNVRLIHEEEKAITDLFETILLNYKCDQKDAIQNITESYDIIKV